MRSHDSPPRSASRREEIVGWCLVGAASVLTVIGLSSAGRAPGVDLPQHALFLQRMLDGGSDVYEVRWVVPYVLLFVIAAPVALLSDPAQGIWTATAVAIALLPIGGATIASSLRRSPALGLFAYLAAFSTPVAWGFSSLVLGAGVFALAIAAAVRYSRRPGVVPGLVLAAALVLAYSAHSVGWVITVTGCWLVVLLWPPRFRAANLWPLLLGTGAGVALMNAWLIGMVRPWAQNYLAIAAQHEEHDTLSRILRLPFAVTEYGRAGAMFWPWVALALLFLIAAVSSWRELARVRTRARRIRRAAAKLSVLERGRRALRRYGLALAWATTVLAYFVTPLWVGQTLMVYPRMMAFGVVLAPAVFLGRRRQLPHWLAVAAIVPAMLLIRGAVNETAAYAEQTKCIDVLTRKLRPQERILSLYYGPARPGSYSAPVDLHLAAEMAARRGGMIGKDFTDYGYGPVGYRKGYDRLVVPANLVWNSRLYDHARHGREFTAWLLIGLRGDIRRVVRATFGASEALHATVCGAFTLVLDSSVIPGRRKSEVFLPHFHREGSCSVEAHAAALSAVRPAQPALAPARQQTLQDPR
jgi:hypothetical protein